MATLAGVQRGYVITTWRRLFLRCGYQRDSCRDYITIPAVVLT